MGLDLSDAGYKEWVREKANGFMGTLPDPFLGRVIMRRACQGFQCISLDERVAHWEGLEVSRESYEGACGSLMRAGLLEDNGATSFHKLTRTFQGEIYAKCGDMYGYGDVAFDNVTFDKARAVVETVFPYGDFRIEKYLPVDREAWEKYRGEAQKRFDDFVEKEDATLKDILGFDMDRENLLDLKIKIPSRDPCLGLLVLRGARSLSSLDALSPEALASVTGRLSSDYFENKERPSLLSVRKQGGIPSMSGRFEVHLYAFPKQREVLQSSLAKQRELESLYLEISDKVKTVMEE